MFSDFSALIRWSLPGWVFSLTLLLPHALSMFELIDRKSPWLPAVLNPSTAGQVLPAIGGIVVILSVPVGFLIYQLYFWYYWTIGDQVDWGNWSNMPEATVKGLSIHSTVKELNKSSTHKAWFVAESTWYIILATQSKEAIALLSSRAARLWDLYHALGATATAISIGTLLNLATVNYWTIFMQWGVIIPYVVVVSFVMWATHKNRSYTRRNLYTFQNLVMTTLEAEHELARQRAQLLDQAAQAAVAYDHTEVSKKK